MKSHVHPNIKIDDVVLVYDNKIPRLLWRLGRVAELITSKDKAIRAAVVRTVVNNKAVNIKRPVNMLYPVEGDDHCNDVETIDCNEFPPKRNRPLRAAAIAGIIRRKFVDQ